MRSRCMVCCLLRFVQILEVAYFEWHTGRSAMREASNKNLPDTVQAQMIARLEQSRQEEDDQDHGACQQDERGAPAERDARSGGRVERDAGLGEAVCVDDVR